jgi:hypothetical protein
MWTSRKITPRSPPAVSPPDRPRRKDGPTLRRFRSRGGNQPYSGRSHGDRVDRGLPGHLRACHCRRPGHHWLIDRRQLESRYRARNRPRLRCPDRPITLDVEPDTMGGQDRTAHWGRQCLVDPFRRSEGRSGLYPCRKFRAGLLRWHSQGRRQMV